MDLKELKALVKNGEGLHLEFKLKAAHPEKIVREIVAFANTEGGRLIVGISDDKNIIGVKFPDEEEFTLNRAINKYCFPEISFTLERLMLPDEKEVLIYDIPKSITKPHYVKNEDNENKTYIRIEDRSVQASKEMKEILKGERKQKNFRFEYGDKERLLVEYITKHKKITIDEFMIIAGISRHIASRTLVLLVLSNVLKIKPGEEVDFFFIKEKTLG